MNELDAIKRLEALELAIGDLDEAVGPDLTALHMGKEALKKRVPMVPVRDSLADRACPACDAYIPFDALNDRITDAPRFCQHCGQALDWGENDV